jgi:hypothetical protein
VKWNLSGASEVPAKTAAGGSDIEGEALGKADGGNAGDEADDVPAKELWVVGGSTGASSKGASSNSSITSRFQQARPPSAPPPPNLLPAKKRPARAAPKFLECTSKPIAVPPRVKAGLSPVPVLVPAKQQRIE